jgi:hypothetical protein
VENENGNFLLNEELLQEAAAEWPDDNGEIVLDDLHRLCMGFRELQFSET